jgi:hypothetical protein
VVLQRKRVFLLALKIKCFLTMQMYVPASEREDEPTPPPPPVLQGCCPTLPAGVEGDWEVGLDDYGEDDSCWSYGTPSSLDFWFYK